MVLVRIAVRLEYVDEIVELTFKKEISRVRLYIFTDFLFTVDVTANCKLAVLGDGQINK